MPSNYSYQNGLLALEKTHEAPSPFKLLPTQGVLKPIAPVFTVSDLEEANQAVTEADPHLRVASSRNLGSLNGPEHDGNFELSAELTEVFGNEGAIDEIMSLFKEYEIPLGLLNKLASLARYDVNFIIDDSGSTKADSDALLDMAHPFMKKELTIARRQRMSRFQEIESRLHFLVDFLAYFPTVNLNFTFLNSGANNGQFANSGKSFNMSNSEGLTPKAYADKIHQEIKERFSFSAKFQTPIFRELSQSLQDADDSTKPTHHYLLTDGVPSDGPAGASTRNDRIDAIVQLIRNRRSPEENLVTLCSCSNQDEEVEWLKRVEEAAYFCSESDDFYDELREIRKDQGPAFPFTYGFWLMMQLAAAKNPNDLDQMDENLPYTKHAFQELLGRTLSNEEYRYYFDLNPHAKLYRDFYDVFATDTEHSAKNLISRECRLQRERVAGYENGGLPGNAQEASLYAYLPLSRHSFTQLYHPEVIARANQPVDVGCCGGFFSSPPSRPAPFVELETYRNYFESLPFIQALSSEPRCHAYKESLFNALSTERAQLAHQVINFDALQAQVDKRYDDAPSAVGTQNSGIHPNQVALSISGFNEPPRYG